MNLIPVDEETCSVCRRRVKKTDEPFWIGQPHYADVPRAAASGGYFDDPEDLEYEYELFLAEQSAERADYTDSMERSHEDGWYYDDSDDGYHDETYVFDGRTIKMPNGFHVINEDDENN